MSIKVLVADDSITIQKVIGIIFGGDEYSLTVVDNGKAAVDKAREINPDILLIDALMPGMTGYEVAETVRATPSLASKPILILTGSFEPFDEDKAKKCGADDFIAKPFESQQILTKVRELIEIGRTRASSTQPSPPPKQTVVEPPQEVPASIFDPEPPQVNKQPEVLQPEPPADIWGAFTTEAEPAAETVVPPVVAPPVTAATGTMEPDVFSIVSEEDESLLLQTPAPADISAQQTGSQWIPVEENTFEFEEDVIADPPSTVFTDQPVPFQEPSFGDIAFEDEVPQPDAPAAFSAPEEVISPILEPAVAESSVADFAVAGEDVFEVSAQPEPAVPFAPLSDPEPVTTAEPASNPIAVEAAPAAVASTASTAIAAPVTLTDEQLKQLLSGVSRDVIEKIVWEVVPDLAEALILEAIRKIKDGI